MCLQKETERKRLQIDGFIQERRNSIANELELRRFALTHRNDMYLHDLFVIIRNISTSQRFLNHLL